MVTVGVRTVMAYPAEILRLREATRAAIAGGSGTERLTAIFELAGAMLLAAHEITDETAAALLDMGDDLSRFISELLDVAFDLTTAPARGPEGDGHD